METNRLKAFCLIVETGSLTAAAKLLNVTHSSLSKAMKVLQDETGRTLLQAAGRGLTVTEDGQLFFTAAKELLNTESRLFGEKRQAPSSNLKIGAPEIFLSGLAEAFASETFAGRTATLLDLDPGALEQQIAAKQLDFGVTYAPFPSEAVEISAIGDYRLGCFHRAGVFDGATLAELPFVVPAQGLSTNPLGLKERDGWLASLQPRREAYAVNLLSTALELTLNGLSAIHVPAFVAHRLNARGGAKLLEVPLPKSLRAQKQTAFAVRAKGRPEDRDFKKFCAAIRKMIRE